jgi:O-acetyl-ADP-ribose deacetylase (regulator of RNase III)
MIISTVKGNLILNAQQGKYKAIIQGCNIFCVMGAGLAPQIATAWPEAEVADNMTIKGDVTKLGTYSEFLDRDRNCRIINMYTQAGTFGRRQGIPDVDYKAIADGFAMLNYDQTDRFRSDHRKVGIPMIGAGLAGGHWEAIKTIINLVTPDLDIELVMYEPPVANPKQFSKVLVPSTPQTRTMVRPLARTKGTQYWSNR